MTLEFTKRARHYGNSLLQEIQDHFADGVDLIGVGVLQGLLTFVPIGFLEDAVQERTLSFQAIHTSQGA